MGHRPRGLLRGRRRVGVLHPRPGPLARLPLGRGRHRRHLGRPRPAVLRARAVERRRPDPQGAAVRPDQRGGQPRRGRQGVLLLRRRHADPRVRALPLQVPAGGVPVRGPRQDERRPFARGARVRAARHRGLRRGPLLRRRDRAREGVARGHPRPDHRPQPRAGAGDAPPAADAVVPQHLVRRRRRDGPAVPPRHPGRGPARPGRARGAGRAPARVRRLARAPRHRQRDQRRAADGRAQPRAVREGRDRGADRRRTRRGR